MSTVTCPEGHASDDPSYCSVCGAKIGGASSAAAPTATQTCPHCDAPRDASDKFCEVCGYDFVTGTLPAPKPQAPATPVPAAPAVASPWWAVVSADRGFYDRNEVTEVQFPLGASDRKFQLDQEKVTIGRRSRSRGVEPDIDLADPPEDAAISHGHATLLRQADGSYALVDNGSSNGTYLNDTAEAVAPNTPVPLKAGDHFNLGAWTRITIELRNADPSNGTTTP